MYINKLEFPAFRALRNVVLEFDGNYDPRIFPIGSENGGGKSTLLQLIFVLLHCSADERQHSYIRNLLASERNTHRESSQEIAAITLTAPDLDNCRLEFISLGDRFLAEKLPQTVIHGFHTHSELQRMLDSAANSERQRNELAKVRDYYSAQPPERDPRADPSYRELLARIQVRPRGITTARALAATLDQQIKRITAESANLPAQIEQITADSNRINGLMASLDYHYITSYLTDTDLGESNVDPSASSRNSRGLICRAAGVTAERVREALLIASSKVFLLGPSNQQYLFLDMATRRAFLGTQAEWEMPDNETGPIDYLTKLASAEESLAGFYAYDWLSVQPLVELFTSARNADFGKAVETGSYGTAYTDLLRQANSLLHGKKVRPHPDLSGVEFLITDAQGRQTPIGLEDLSQGELKRLMIYAWLRANRATDAVVLIDEIETSFHPDWQIGIIRDLQDWAPGNQYLLATHSYDLCQALTPRHVRVLSPPLRLGPTLDGVPTPVARHDD